MNSSDLIRQPENLDDKIWRYMDLPKLIYLLEKEKLYLSRADHFDDKHEGSTPKVQEMWEKEKHPEYSNGVASFRRRQREWTFISCWSHCEHESHALWRIFCGPKQGVAVGSRYRRLAELEDPRIEDIRVGLVDYGKEEPIPANTLIPFFRKRKAFAYEREARLVVNMYRCTDGGDQTGKLSILRPYFEKQLDLSTFVEAIRIHPEADISYVDAVKSLVKKYAPKLLDQVETSEMAESPVF
jgi:hypothetical protein